jgi:Uma2 family endonuclease
MATTEHITTAEQLLLRAPGLGRCELLRGELIMMSPAGARHGRIVANITGPLIVFVKQKALGRVYGAETGFWIGRKPDTVRAPDVAFVSNDRLGGEPERGFFEGPPDLAVEVLLPEDRPGEVAAKVQDWLAAGCRLVWVVDPQTQSVPIHRHGGTGVVLGAEDQLGGEDLVPGFTLPVTEIFA